MHENYCKAGKKREDETTTVNAEYDAERSRGLTEIANIAIGAVVRSRLFADNNTSVGITECPGLLVFCRCNRFYRNINRPMAR